MPTRRCASAAAPAAAIARDALVDPPVELVQRHVERDDQRRAGARPPSRGDPSRRRERGAGLGELERPNEALAVVRVNARRGGRIALGEQGVCGLGAEPVDFALPVLPPAGRGRRRQLERGERGAEVQPGPPATSGTSCPVDRRVREPLILADRDVLGQRDDADEVCGVGRARR